MAKRATSKTKKRATKIENLETPQQELAPEEAERVSGGTIDSNRALKEQVRIAQQQLEQLL
jgi:hypothetical protein